MIRVIAELGTAHGGDFETALRMQEAAADAGCWASKLQVRTNMEECTPAHLWATTREWNGERIPYLEYRRRVEFSDEHLNALYDHARDLGLEWFASVWDVASVARLAAIQREYVKVPSAMNTNATLHAAITRAKFGKVFLSAGMADNDEIRHALEYGVGHFGRVPTVLMHCVAMYPCPDSACHLARLRRFQFGMDSDDGLLAAGEYGYSGHERGILPSLIAVGLGATYIERHLTLDKGQPGSDQECSLEPQEMAELVRQCQEVESMLGDGAKFPLPEEEPAMRRLRPNKPLTPIKETA